MTTVASELAVGPVPRTPAGTPLVEYEDFPVHGHGRELPSVHAAEVVG
jgi:hypothetical protein